MPTINIIILTLFAIILAFTYIYPMMTDYNPFANLLNAEAKHLTPTQAMNLFGHNIHWILGAGASGQSTFDAVWYGARISVSLAFICARSVPLTPVAGMAPIRVPMMLERMMANLACQSSFREGTKSRMRIEPEWVLTLLPVHPFRIWGME